MILRHFALIFLIALSGLLGAGRANSQPAQVRVVGDGIVTRVTVFGPAPLVGDVFLAENHSQQEIIILVPDMAVAPGGAQPVDDTTGVKAYEWRDGQLSLELARPMMVARRLNLPPAGSEPRHRLVLDLAGVSDVRFARHAVRDNPRLKAAIAARDSQLAEAAASQALNPPAGSRRYVIVIDPGHGGKDPGARSISGGVEKTLVLKAALELRDLLVSDYRYDVRLTRQDDTYIALEDRVTLARQWGADLFISLHADAAGSKSVEGASVYTLSSRGEGRIDAEARKNDWSMPIESGVPHDVSGILEDLIKRETRTNSGLFAQMLLPELERAGPVLRNTHRNAGFYVLLAPDVPAVLLEIGFLTNKADAQRLSSREGRGKTLLAVRSAIDTYFDRQDVIYAQN